MRIPLFTPRILPLPVKGEGMTDIHFQWIQKNRWKEKVKVWVKSGGPFNSYGLSKIKVLLLLFVVVVVCCCCCCCCCSCLIFFLGGRFLALQHCQKLCGSMENSFCVVYIDFHNFYLLRCELSSWPNSSQKIMLPLYTYQK